MSKEKTPAQIRLDGVTFSWPFLFEKDDNDKHRVTILVDKKDKESLKKIQTALKYAYEEGVKNPKKWNGKKPKVWKNPLKDGDKPLENGEDNLPENAGKWYFTASSERPVPVLDKNKKELTSDDDFFAGCIGSAAISVSAYANKSVGIAMYINGIVKTGEGERLGGIGKINIDDTFGDLFEDSDDDDDFPDNSNSGDDDDDFNPFG